MTVDTFYSTFNKNAMKKNFFKLICLWIIAGVVISCDSDEEVDPKRVEDASFLVVDATKILRNQEISINLVDAADVNRTQIGNFFVNGSMLENNSFSSAVEGTFEIYAEYNLAGTLTRTDTATIEVFIPKRKVLVEDYTGTWCGHCPNMTLLIEEAQTLTADISVVSIHGNSIFTGTDPFTIDEGMFLKNFFEVPGYPTGIVDRDEFWNESNIAPQIVDNAGVDSNLSIALSSSIQGEELSAMVEVISEEEISNKNVVVFLLEDNLIADQRSYYSNDPSSPWYQMGDYLIGFRHDHVLRMSLTAPLGDAISVTPSLEKYQKVITTTLPAEFVKDELSLVVIVTDATTNKAINSQHARINVSREFE